MMILKSYFSELVVLPFFWFIKISKVGTKVPSNKVTSFLIITKSGKSQTLTLNLIHSNLAQRRSGD